MVDGRWVVRGGVVFVACLVGHLRCILFGRLASYSDCFWLLPPTRQSLFVCHICVVVLLLQWQLLLLLLGPFLAFLLLAGPALFCVLFWLGGPVGQEGARLADCFI